ncbi:hypothetical protein GCM10022198_12680 [Klugiella xanthotipulae]|uniref:Parallel beta-helix repeat protein n=1 Tax=Klugiella xanthotipulae TaxID=244735 RepID=A0A543I444_9MICO|nr:right-handed parallel beta-helix repeat-containing protein [Klugiella xanthotipulae]TQM65358.1 parallel beta-helix repeat protein [Klugiella xanthotipulae]
MMRHTSRLAAVVTAGGLLSTAILPGLGTLDTTAAWADTTSDTGAEPTTDTGSTGRAYPGDPDRESVLVTREEARIDTLRGAASAAQWPGSGLSAPFTVTPANALPTVVLVPATAPYTYQDLVDIPDTLSRQPDGSYLLSKSVVVVAGATLDLSMPNDHELHLASSPDGYVSILGLGGTLRGAGTAEHPLTITGWDAAAQTPDTLTDDGRAYIRTLGGTAVLSQTHLDHLGFWSGNTGGLAITGASEVSTPADADTSAASGAPATGRLDHVIIDGNAFGIFVNGATGVSIINSLIVNSLVDGIVFHREVTSSSVRSTITSNNAVDGLSVTRASTGIHVTGVTSEHNGRDGFAFDGTPLADGPSATGAAVDDYGNNVLSTSTTSTNERYGVRVVGGENVQVTRNTVRNNETGIALSGAASDVVVSHNTVTNSDEHGITVVDAVQDASVTGNTVTGADTGIYLRDSTGQVTGNTVTEATNHGVTLVGTNNGSVVKDNTLAGEGPTAIDLERGTGTTLGTNAVADWSRARSLPIIIREIFQPLTVLWVILATLLVLTATRGARRRTQGIHNPYEEMRPLSQFTEGMVSPEAVGLVASPVPATAHSTVRYGEPDNGPAGVRG